jgi:hypothetical protein
LFNRKNFHGTVILKDSLVMPHDGYSYVEVMGTVSILTDEEIAGFKAGDHESPWVARVEGPSGAALVILGCQVRAVLIHPPMQPRSKSCWVMT